MNRTLLLGTAWTASAAAAVGLGFLAVSLVDAEASPGTVPLAATGSSASLSPSTGPAPGGPTGEQATVGGTAYASCEGAVPVVASAPSPGWSVDDSPSPGQVEFRNGSQQVEIHVLCSDGTPTFRVEGPRADDSGHGDDAGSSSSVAVTPSVTPTPDDSSGRIGGGHGADDAPGDDSGGRTGGGHGADG